MAPSNSAAVKTSITINAPPSKVREVMLDFTTISSLKNPFLTSLAAFSTVTREPIPGIDAKEGDIVKLSSASSIIGESDNLVFVNTPTKYGWRGGKGGLVARHTFEFLPTTGSGGEGKTLFKHEESFEGGVAFIFWWGMPMRLWFNSLFGGFNEDLKNLVEGRK